MEQRPSYRAGFALDITLEVMEELLVAIIALLHWRFVLTVAGAIAFTLTLSNLFVGFTAGYCIGVVILCAAFGMYWQGRSEAGIGIATKVVEPKISRPVAFIGLSFVGLLWGGLITEFSGSELLAVTSLILSVAVVGVWYGVVLRRPIPPRTLAFLGCALLSGFLAVLIVVQSNA
ncbi:MAG: hypothetical protein KBC92_10965 [Giesbergeria sp.]|jgi:hypothetical protein|nr:hypothetical protein [Giesbergeria sp.]MBP6158901.1 hypothetical protein [Giesbergeria sp.]MBP7083571.1 hypothetical protein [Giesbergeria sp.]MBP9784943.1 hypothetical protein [Giesbergeria sp.]